MKMSKISIKQYKYKCIKQDLCESEVYKAGVSVLLQWILFGNMFPKSPSPKKLQQVGREQVIGSGHDTQLPHPPLCAAPITLHSISVGSRTWIHEVQLSSQSNES